MRRRKAMAVRGSALGTERELELFDRQPIRLEGFVLHPRSVEVAGRPALPHWQAAFAFACATQIASPFWVADLLNYAESRSEWREKLDQAVSHGATNYHQHTLETLSWVGRQVQGKARALAPSLSHATEVAALEADEQIHWLQEARTNGWSQRELRQNLRAAKRRALIEGQAVLEGRYRVILADCPWLYRDSGATEDGSLGKAERHYPGMTIEQLCKLPVAAHALPNAVLFLWVTAPMLLMNPGPRDVLESWGFCYKTCGVWDKVLGNFGHYFHIVHEHLLVCTRGSCLPDQPTPSPKSIFTERRSGTHSEKPVIARQIIEQLYTAGPYLELFARERHERWSVFGNDPALWCQEVAVGPSK